MVMTHESGLDDPRVLGDRLRQYIRRAGKTQAKVADEVGMDPTYLSQLVNGRVNWVKSDYFRALVNALDIPVDDIAELNPSAVFSVTAEKQGEQKKPKRPISDSLKEAAAIYGGRFPDLATPLWQDYLESFRPRGLRADTPEAWLDLYRDLAKHGITPGGN